jgi:hypothetical protein
MYVDSHFLLKKAENLLKNLALLKEERRESGSRIRLSLHNFKLD